MFMVSNLEKISDLVLGKVTEFQRISLKALRVLSKTIGGGGGGGRGRGMSTGGLFSVL